MWEKIIWPLVLENDRPYFSTEEYHKVRNNYCEKEVINKSKVVSGFVSLIARGLLVKDKDREIYSVHYKVIPYMRKKIMLDYGQAVREVITK